jgi:hypothetical protein
MSSVRVALEHWRDLAARPPTDEQLAKIWPPWNALPPDMIPELKLRILTLDESSKYERDPERLAAFQNLRRQFPYLPLDKPEFNQALNQVQRWSSLSRFFQTTVALHKALVTRQWAFAEADADASGRIAIFRAVQEIEMTHPGLLKSTSPKLADISYLDSRYAAYLTTWSETGVELKRLATALGAVSPILDVPSNSPCHTHRDWLAAEAAEKPSADTQEVQCQCKGLNPACDICGGRGYLPRW